MLPKKKIAAAIIILLIVISIGYFYFEGEKVKEEFVYQYERNTNFQETQAKDYSVVVVLAFLTYYLQNNENNPDTATITELCKEDYEACVEAIAPNAEIKQACKQAINSIQEMTQKIKNENSVVLGFNRTVLHIGMASCKNKTVEAPGGFTYTEVDMENCFF